jgi:hypothetical protein
MKFFFVHVNKTIHIRDSSSSPCQQQQGFRLPKSPGIGTETSELISEEAEIAMLMDMGRGIETLLTHVKRNLILLCL